MEPRVFINPWLFLVNIIYMKARSRKIIRVSILGIVVNLALAGFKIFVGLLSNSIAIILDAVNNFSDSLSSIVTIVGTRFASKAPDKHHPMGHGRSEYLSTVIIAMIIIYIGLTAMIESVKKIIDPPAVNYTTQTVIVVSVAIVAKILLGLYVRHRGKKLQSGSLIGSGLDALYDAIISVATLTAIIIYYATGWEIEAYLAAAISLFILYSGIKLVRGAFSIIIGERPSSDLTRRIKNSIAQFGGVNGAFDLVMHDYGNGSTVASVNIEIDHEMRASDIDDLTRSIQKAIYRKYRIILSSIGIYAIDLSDPEVERLWQKVSGICDHYDKIIELHGFHVDLHDHEISFDIVVDFTTPNRRNYYQKFCREVEAKIPNYQISVTLDSDISD